MNFNEFYTGGGKRMMPNNVEARNMMSECFMNRNGGGHYSEFANYPMMGHVGGYPPEYDHYDRRSRSSGRSRSRLCRFFYSSDDSSLERPSSRSSRRRRNYYKDNKNVQNHQCMMKSILLLKSINV